MDEIDKTIDEMNHDQLSTAIAKNQGKRREINVRFTTENQRVSVERLDKIYFLFERLLKEVIKIWMRDEKIVRSKYLKPMSDQRKKNMVLDLRREIDLILLNLKDVCRSGYEKVGQVEKFDQKFQVTEDLMRSEIETKALETQRKINEELNQTQKIEPSGLVKRYGIDEPTLIDLRIIEPLQKINVSLGQWPEDWQQAASGIHETIALCSKYYQKGALKNIVLTLETLVHQGNLGVETRNNDIIQKSWNRLLDLLRLAPESELRISKIEPLYQIFEQNEK